MIKMRPTEPSSCTCARCALRNPKPWRAQGAEQEQHVPYKAPDPATSPLRQVRPTKPYPVES